MGAFYLAYTEEVQKLPRPVAESDGENLPLAVAGIPWVCNADLLVPIFWYRFSLGDCE